jgi:dTDP-D-glucose 4,6-dehydratase
VTHYVADIRKAHDLLGWEPRVPLDEGIPRAVAWFREHPEHAADFVGDWVPQEADFKVGVT